MDKKNTIKVYTTSSGAELNISAPSTKQVISATNNRAQYFAEQAKKYRDEAKTYRDNAKYYAEQNSDVTFEYIDKIRASLEDKISTKQNAGDYALKKEIPENVSELINDAEYVNKTELDEVRLPSQEGCAGRVLMSDGENESWVGISTFQLFDTVLKDHILTYEESKGWALQGTYVYKEAVAGSRYGYPDFYAKCLEEYNEATNTETVNDVTVKVHSNGHKFFDIANKDSIDEIYNSSGMAWYYGIDTENERIFLPRNNWFEQASTSDVGQSVEAGLPNHNHTITATRNMGNGTNASTVENPGWCMDSGWVNSAISKTSSNASSSNSIYGKSNTVQPNAIKKLLYICVGNTEVESVITDVVDVTTTENDTIPLGYSTYQSSTQPSVSWLKSEGQWNDGNIYTTFYNYFVQKIGEAFANGYVKEVTETYDDYDLVINQDDMTFRLPLLDGSEDILGDKYIDLTLGASKSIYTAPANGLVVAAKRSNAENQYFIFTTQEKSDERTSSYYGALLTPSLSVKRNDQLKYQYDVGGSTEYFRFIPFVGNGSLYFKVANVVENLELLDAGEVLNSLSSIIPNNSSLITNYLMPDYETRVMTTTSGYVCPYNCFITIWASHGNYNKDSAVYINGNFIANVRDQIYNTTTSADLSVQFYASKGDVITWEDAATLLSYKLKGDI